jgi:hypothetical protein
VVFSFRPSLGQVLSFLRENKGERRLRNGIVGT